MEKSELRKQILEKLKSMNSLKKNKIEQDLYTSIFRAPLWKEANVIGITCSQSFEWNTFPIIEQAWLEKKIVAVPKSFPEKYQMKFFIIHNKNELIKGYANILEPDVRKTKMINHQTIDLLFVPGLLFDNDGYRIGFGGGYYDRFLQQFSNPTISLVSEFQMVDRVPRHSFDIPVDFLVNKEGWIKTSTVDI